MSYARSTSARLKLNSDALQQSLLAVRQHLQMPLSYISFFVGDDVTFQEVSSDDDKPLLSKGDRRPAEGTYCNAVLNGTLPPFIPDTAAYPAAMDMPITRNAPVGAVVSVPLRSNNEEIIGMFCCLSPHPRPDLTKRDHKTMQMFAKLAQDMIRDADSATPQHDDLRATIARIIRNREFDTVLQPIFDLNHRKMLGAEALTRFHAQPYRSPDLWFADAACAGMKQELELAAFQQAIALLDQFAPGTYLSVNVSPGVLINGNLENIIASVDCSKLLIEITEHDQIKDMHVVKRAMDRLRFYGVQFAIDDLGAGHSGLSMILKLKPEVLKMDRSLVSGIHLSDGSQALARSLVYFASKIGARLIAEGIELEDEARALDNIGVVYGQGYMLGRPQAAQAYFAAAA